VDLWREIGITVTIHPRDEEKLDQQVPSKERPSGEKLDDKNEEEIV
jgi:hypothetical protein